MSLNLASLDEAFGKQYQSSSDEIYKNVGLQAEADYIKVDTEDNKIINYLQTKNYRTTNYTQNPDYLFKKDAIYDLQGIHDGKGPGRNVSLDDKMTRSNLSAKPQDRLSEAVTFIRRVDFLPKKTKSINNSKFLVSTSLRSRPQSSFCPQFDTYGVSCRDYGRKTGLYFKNAYQRKGN